MSGCHDMIGVAARASRILRADAVANIVAFLDSRKHPDGGFRGRSDTSDLYYTVFGVMCLSALNRSAQDASMRRYLESFDTTTSLDFIHMASLVRCWAAMQDQNAMDHGRAFLPSLENHRAADGGYDHVGRTSARGTVYGGFLACLAYGETGMTVPRPDALLRSLVELRTGDGGYANGPCIPGSTASATAAAILLQRWLGNVHDPLAVAALQACESPEGGFRASARAPGSDLLSTATALYALRASGVPPAYRERHTDFVAALWADDGGFYGHPAEPVTDIEYSFYGLLALGCLHDG